MIEVVCRREVCVTRFGALIGFSFHNLWDLENRLGYYLGQTALGIRPTRFSIPGRRG
jgi:hypothetical protein